jgi:hypothetical protein
MLARFNGGPWDGVEIEIPFTPEQISFRTRNVWFDTKGPLDNMAAFVPKEDHLHEYLASGPKLREGVLLNQGETIELLDDSLVVHQYRYAPGEPTEWDRLASQVKPSK